MLHLEANLARPYLGTNPGYPNLGANIAVNLWHTIWKHSGATPSGHQSGSQSCVPHLVDNLGNTNLGRPHLATNLGHCLLGANISINMGHANEGTPIWLAA